MDNKISFFKYKHSVLFVLMFCFLVMDGSVASAQSNRHKRLNNFSTSGRGFATIRHGITLHIAGGLSANITQQQPMMIVPGAGVGYVASQYYGVGNRFMQQSITYQFGYGVTPETFMVHNVIGTFHCTFLGNLDLNPFIYGLALQFTYGGKSKTFPNTYTNFYIRPEIGIALPTSYKARTKEVLPVTAMIVYGFNIKTYWKYHPENEGFPNYQPKDLVLPWASMCHHVITVRINFNIGHLREVKR